MIRAVRLVGRPLERFLRVEAASGILLLAAAALALAWANSPWSHSYFSLWHLPLSLRIGPFHFECSPEWLVNDGLMVIFFLLVGLEIRRELHHGELSEVRKAALPVAAALGGMLVPACAYVALAGAPATRSGWGVPMATDIAFAVGILTLLGRRVPSALRVLLLALAVIDDLGAIIVIALFYSSGVSVAGLLLAGLGVVGVLALRWAGVRHKVAYVLPGFVVWAGVYTAGVHPTIAGVLLGLLTPIRTWLGKDRLYLRLQGQVDELTRTPPEALSSHETASILRGLDRARREALSPAESLIEGLHPWVAFGIMPVFALANAGVSLSAGPSDPDSQRVAVAVAVGLVLGKPLGVLAAIWISLRLRFGALPASVSTRHVLVLGTVAGVGFTMALFIAPLAFSDAKLLAAAKLGVLGASGLAALLSLALGRMLLAPGSNAAGTPMADSADRVRICEGECLKRT